MKAFVPSCLRVECLLLAVLVAQPALAQQPPTATTMRIGLAATLADDDKVLNELARRELDGLCDYMFRKLQVPPEQQAAFRAAASLKRVNEPGLSARQKHELVRNLALGIDRVLMIVKDPNELMRLSNTLIEYGTRGGLNLLEYWGEDPKIQSQVRPVAEAVNKTYLKAIEGAQLRKEKLESMMTNVVMQNQLGPEWEKVSKLITAAKFNLPFNQYTLALSMDKADPKREQVCEAGIKAMQEFENPDYEVVPAASACIAKLHMAKGTDEGLEEARRKFGEVLRNEKSDWAVKFQAMYFTALSRVLGHDVSGANRDMAAVQSWLAANPAPNVAAKKGIDAAMKMLKYRIFTTEAEKATGPAAAKANDDAVAVLQELLKDRPDLEGVINQQLVARLPEQPDLTRLNALLLKALISRGVDELSRDNTQPDRKIIAQAALAARELLRRVGSEGVTADDAAACTLRLAMFCEKLGQDLEAATLLLHHVETYRIDVQLRKDVLDSAAVVIGRLLRAQDTGDAAARATQELYRRFLQIATAPPFNRAEYNFEYGVLLLRRNAALMEGNPTDAQNREILADARKSAALFHSITDPKQKLSALSFEMLAYDQVLDLTTDSAQAREYIARIQKLADQINEIVRVELPRATDDAARLALRRSRVRTLLLAAKLAAHEKGDQRKAALERQLSLLASFEQDVEGLPNANAMLSEALLMRLTALMELGRTEDALKDLGKFLENRSDEQGLAVVIKMVESLGEEYDAAQQKNDLPRMAELAAHRARVSRYLVERAAQSTRPETRKLLPRYRMFEASSLQKAAELEKDPAKKKQYLADALAIYENAIKENPEDRSLILWRAFVQYDMGEYAAAQPTLADFLAKHLLGKPMVMTDTPDGVTMRPNHQYWNAMLRLLRCNVALVKARAPGFNESVLEDTRRMLKQLYITWGEPGGSRWAPQFDELRKEIIPDWTAPPTTQSAPETAPAATRPG